MKHWLIIFLLGINISFQECKSGEVDAVGKVGYYFHNSTGYPIELKSFNIHGDSLRFQIENNDTLYHEYVGWVSTNMDDVDDYYIADILLDSLIISFNTEKCVSYTNHFRKNENFCITNKLSRSPYCVKNYIVEKGNGYHLQYHYFFSEEDFKNAEPCN